VSQIVRYRNFKDSWATVLLYRFEQLQGTENYAAEPSAVVDFNSSGETSEIVTILFFCGELQNYIVTPSHLMYLGYWCCSVLNNR